MKRGILALSLLSVVGMADIEWNGAVLRSLLDQQMTELADKLGAEGEKRIVSVEAKLVPPKNNAVSIKVKFEPKGSPKAVDVLCHEHDPGEVDCHSKTHP